MAEAMTCELFHGTSTVCLTGIAERGLLPPDKADRWVYPSLSRDGVVCAVDNAEEAWSWGGAAARQFGGDIVVLCLDAVDSIARFDQNLDPNGRADGFGFGYAYEIDGGIPPERIRIHFPLTGCKPISLARRAPVNEADRNGDTDAR